MFLPRLVLAIKTRSTPVSFKEVPEASQLLSDPKGSPVANIMLMMIMYTSTYDTLIE